MINNAGSGTFERNMILMKTVFCSSLIKAKEGQMRETMYEEGEELDQKAKNCPPCFAQFCYCR